jgi:hypothetical protein
MTTYAIVNKKELAKVIELVDKLDATLQKVEKTLTKVGTE